MIHESHRLWTKEEYAYPFTGEFIPNIVTYIHDDDKVRPAILVVPGGAYKMVSHLEGEIVAKEFFNKGYNTFVLTYTTNLLMTVPLKLQPLKDLSKAVMFVRKKAQQFQIDPNNVALCGFSAGGHLCGSLAVHYTATELLPGEEYEGVSNRPDAVILSYPVITSGEYALKLPFDLLLGTDATTEELFYMSLEKQVTKQTPPVFLWHTATDEAVPVENSYLFANACKEQGVNFELHVFGNGRHGLSLANQEWASGNLGGDYTMQQLYETLQYAADNRIDLPADFKWVGMIPDGVSVREVMQEKLSHMKQELRPDEGIAKWPELAHEWLKKIFTF